jgi:hypothetical protein
MYYIVRPTVKRYWFQLANFIYDNVDRNTRLGKYLHALFVKDRVQNTIDATTYVIEKNVQKVFPGVSVNWMGDYLNGMYSRYMVVFGVGTRYTTGLTQDVWNLDPGSVATRGPESWLQWKQHGDRVLQDTYDVFFRPLARVGSFLLEAAMLDADPSYVTSGDFMSGDHARYALPQSAYDRVRNRAAEIFDADAFCGRPVPTMNDIVGRLHKLSRLPVPLDTFKTQIIPPALASVFIYKEGKLMYRALQTIIPALLTMLAGYQTVGVGYGRQLLLGQGGGRRRRRSSRRRSSRKR